MDGHVTPVGMQADLDAWKQSGIGGGIYLEINIGVPQGPGTYMRLRHPDCDARVRTVAKHLWGEPDHATQNGATKNVGANRVIFDTSAYCWAKNNPLAAALDMVARLQCSGRQPRHKILHTPLPGENAVALDIAELVFTSNTAMFEVAIEETKIGTGRIVAGLCPWEIVSIEMRGSDEPMHWQFTPGAMELSVPKKKPCNHAYVYKIQIKPFSKLFTFHGPASSTEAPHPVHFPTPGSAAAPSAAQAARHSQSPGG